MDSRALFFALISLCCSVSARGSDNECKFEQPVDATALEDGRLSMIELVRKYEYPIEKYTVLTEDGYLLTVYRIPYGRMCKFSESAKIPVLLQHGLLGSSFDFLLLGPKKSLAYLLADNCYDVWLSNSRGNSESRRHISMNPSQKEFWEFSWHEMGKYDLPALIDYILNATGQPSLHYIGHSQGTTQFFVFGALHPEYHHKIRSMQALSPVAYMKNLQSPIIKVLTMFYESIKTITDMIGMHEMLPNKSFLNLLGSEICKDQYPDLQVICCNVIFLLCGFDEPQLNKTILPTIIGHTPAGAAVKQLCHYAQGVKSGKFRQFNYGLKTNLKIYNSTVPPEYDVRKIKIPVAFYYGGSDFLAAVKDVKLLESQMPNVVEKYLVPYSRFNHLDFIFGTDVKHLLYYRVLEVLKKY